MVKILLLALIYKPLVLTIIAPMAMPHVAFLILSTLLAAFQFVKFNKYPKYIFFIFIFFFIFPLSFIKSALFIVSYIYNYLFIINFAANKDPQIYDPLLQFGTFYLFTCICIIRPSWLRVN